MVGHSERAVVDCRDRHRLSSRAGRSRSAACSHSQANGSLVFSTIVRSVPPSSDEISPAGLLPAASVGGRPWLRGYDFRRHQSWSVESPASAMAGSAIPPRTLNPIVGVRQLAEDYRRRNGLPPMPLCRSTRSRARAAGSTRTSAPPTRPCRVARVARARRLSEDMLRRLVAKHTQGRQFGFLGEPRVSVLALNLALDRLAPPPSRPGR